MSKLFLIGLGAVLMAAPLAGAHLDGTMGYPKPYCEILDLDVHDYGPVATGRLLSDFTDGNLQDCDGDITTPADYDQHSEYARGGAWLLVTTGDGTYGSLACFGELGHHAAYGPFEVIDLVLGTGASIRVAADTMSIVPAPPGEPACGDLQADEAAECVGSCSVTFPPGIDGAYAVFVAGTVGHVRAP